MKKFNFPLDTVLGYKNQVLDSLRNEHASSLNDVIKQEEHIENLQIQYAEFNQSFNEKKAIGITIIEALNYESYLRKLEAIIKQEYKKLNELKKIEEEKRNMVIEAKKETASIEKLKEKKLEQYNKEVQKNEELFIEEFVANSRAVSQ